ITVVALLTLALGIGATSAVFTFVDAGLLRALDFPQSERLVNVAVTKQGEAGDNQAAYPNFVDWREQNHVFSSLAGYAPNGTTMRAADGAQQLVRGGIITPDFFSALGIGPAAGRWFSGDLSQAQHEVVVTYSFWQNRLGGRPEAVGRPVTMQNF